MQFGLRALTQSFDQDEIKPRFQKEFSKRAASMWQVQSAPGFHSKCVLDRQVRSSYTDDRCSTNQTYADLMEAYKKILPAHGILAAMEPLLLQILQSCEGGVIAFRQKALKALSSIVEQDSSIYFQPHVRTAVEKRLMDSSPAVRDAALEMLGRYVVYNPDLAAQYLPRIAERVTDSGLSVRKRVIKLLKGIYAVVEDQAARIEICRRLVGRVNDEDDGVKDLAAAAVEELWFSAKFVPKRSSGEAQREASPAEKRETASKAAVLVAVAGSFREKPSPLEELVRLIISRNKIARTTKKQDGSTPFAANLKTLVEALVDALVDETEDGSITIVNRIKTIYILLLADESMLSVQKAGLLLPYLHGAATVSISVNLACSC